MSNKRAPTKAQTILAEALARVELASEEQDIAIQNMNIAAAKWQACSENYRALLDAFARKPRSTNGSGKSKNVANSEIRKCKQCNNAEDHASHDTTYLTSHPFVLASRAPSAGKKSSSKSAPKTAGVQSSPTSSVTVLSAGDSETAHEQHN